MTAVAADTWWMTVRRLQAFVQQPAFLVITLVQPVIWLFLFGALFRRVVELPGFTGGSYVDYLVPGVVVMSAVSSNMWAGMAMLEEIERGTLNRFLVTPVRRSAVMNASVVEQGVSTAIQSLIIVGLGLLAGATYRWTGVAVLVLAAVALGTFFGALSNTIGMLVRQRETIIGFNTLLLLPLTFLSSAFLPAALMPGWIRAVAHGNPVDWALRAGRAALNAPVEWATVGRYGGALCALAAVTVALSIRTFRSYQKSV